MRFFRNLSISGKLAAVFLFLLFMMGVGGSVGLYNAVQLANVTERLYLNSFKRAEMLSTVENEFIARRQEVFLHSILTDPSSKSFLEISAQEREKKIENILYQYRTMGMTEDAERLYDNLVVNLAGYWHIHGRVIDLSNRGFRTEALSILRMEGQKAFTDALDSLQMLTKSERDTAFEAYRSSDRLAKVITALTAGLTLLAITLAGGLWLILIRSIVKPILTLEESAKTIGSGDFSHRVPIVTEDEIGALAIEFNKMAESLRDYYTTLEKKVEERTEELEAALGELKQKKQEIELANIELRDANRMKSQFLANVSHELRTPLNSIIGFSELLSERAFGDLNDRQGQYVDYIHSSGGHLLRLINNILDLSKIEAGKMELVFEEFPIMEVLGEALGITRPLAHEKNVAIEVKTTPASPMLRADKAKFKQIVLNLLSNAVKFNVNGGKVDVDWEIIEAPSGIEIKRFIVFSIKDTGIGIKEEDRKKLFKEFEQIDSSLSREYEGTGLGLVLTKRLVELHNGEIWFDSKEGAGSTFYVKLPQGTEAVELPAIPVRAYAQAAGDEKLPLVLLASESPDINHLLEIYLDRSYDVLVSSDGFDLINRAREQKPFAIIMGITIHGKDGWEVLKELKSSQSTMHVPVVIISSIDNKELGLSLGAVEYLEKPVNREKLLAVLSRLRSVKTK